MVLAGLLAGLLGTHLLGFSYHEMEPVAALLPPGTMALPAAHRSFTTRSDAFSRLDLDGSGAVECRRVGSRAWCDELSRANSVLRQLQRGWRNAMPARPALDDGLSVARWRTLLARVTAGDGAVRLADLPADGDGDGRVAYNEMILVAAHLAFSSTDAVAAGLDEEGRLLPDRFPGIPRPRAHLLGTDSLGRDVAVRLLHGLRVSLLVALCATAVAFLLGALFGLTSGFLGGTADQVFLRIVEVLQAIPFIFVFILIAVLVQDVLEMRWSNADARALAQAMIVFAALGAVQWFSLARYARGLAVSLKHSWFIRALRGMGLPTSRIVTRHLLPNTLLPLSAYAILLVPTLVLEEAFLSFLGFGVQPPYPSLGTMLNEGVAFMESAPALLFLPAAVILLLTWSLNAVGERLVSRFSPAGQGGDS